MGTTTTHTESLRRHLTKKGYVRIPLSKTPTGHLTFQGSINQVIGTFILDTGASSTCVDFKALDGFKLLAEASEVKAAGAGAVDMLTEISSGNTLAMGDWQAGQVAIVLFDLSHVNTALTTHDIPAVDGIVGADILERGHAVIDYQYTCFYMK